MSILAFFLPLLASFLSFFSGFGLGTLLLPFFMLILYPQEAIAFTGLIHFLNNIFKFFLLYKNVDIVVSLAFGIPAMMAAYLGVLSLKLFISFNDVFAYELLGHSFYIKPINVVLGLLMIFFALWEMLPIPSFRINKQFLPLGGMLSGYFGGLLGHQGAFRSIFLLRYFLRNKEGFIATSVLIACLVDMVRIGFYEHFGYFDFHGNSSFVLISLLSTFLGSFIANKFLKKVTIKAIQKLVGILLLILGVLITAGVI